MADPAPQRPSVAAAHGGEIVDPRHFRRTLWSAVALPFVLGAVLTLVLAWQVVELLALTDAVRRADRIIAQARRTEKLLVDLETGLRGYLLTSRPEFLEPYDQAAAALPAAFTTLEGLVAGSEGQARRVAELRRGHRTWSTFARLALERHGRGEDVVPHVARGDGKRTMDGLRAQVDALVAREERLRDVRSAATTRAAWRGAAVGVALALLLNAVLGITSRRRLVGLSRTYERALADLQRQAASLREREALFAAFMDNSPGVAFMKDPAGRLVYVNAGMERLFGQPREALLGTGDEKRLPAPIVRQLRANDRAVLASQRPVELVEIVPDADGELHRWLVFKFPFRDASGQQLLGGVGVDIEERERALEEVRHVNAELERHVERRTAELTAANRELEAFGYSISHDLRAPLRAIDGFARAVLEDHGEYLAPAARDHLHRVRGAADRMGKLIDDLLRLSRLTRAEVERVPIDVTALAREVEADLRRSDPDRRVEVDVQDGLRVHADPRLLRLVLENLMGNGWKFTATRPLARIEVGDAGGGDPSGRGGPVLFVTDNGVGFDMAHAGNLFSPFQRLHATRHFPGTGVGLASVQRIVRRHGGSVWAEAEPDQGATFFFSLPPAPASENGTRTEPALVAAT